VRAVLQRAAVVAVLLWLMAWALYLGSGRWSIVLLLAPPAFALGDALAVRRKTRLSAQVDAALPQLVADEDSTDGLRVAEGRIIDRRDRLVGALPPRLIAVRLLEMPDGQRYRVRAAVSRSSDPAAIEWRVERVVPASPSRR